MFRGETLRGLSLNAYGRWTIGQYAFYAAIGLTVAAVAVFLAAMGVVAKLEKPPKRIINVNGDTVFFPSYSETFDQGLLDGHKLAANEYCRSCHPDSFHQWERSAHRFSPRKRFTPVENYFPLASLMNFAIESPAFIANL